MLANILLLVLAIIFTGKVSSSCLNYCETRLMSCDDDISCNKCQSYTYWNGSACAWAHCMEHCESCEDKISCNKCESYTYWNGSACVKCMKYCESCDDNKTCNKCAIWVLCGMEKLMLNVKIGLYLMHWTNAKIRIILHKHPTVKFPLDMCRFNRKLLRKLSHCIDWWNCIKLQSLLAWI